eukprot:CAMPEP_0115195906 /NCGR_PEP_ID=MMETSP0270-20121206/14818_1 /TAXON_ID=71861 /ORGANISM="Scrippsiella trochoidea, Strain CCMP3099" /LENGTH=317 /DNA_ID=CAMNT_0002609235 /DNA_START=75 /DNA_END=1028 /DNA_ORIENTATION=-
MEPGAQAVGLVQPEGLAHSVKDDDASLPFSGFGICCACVSAGSVGVVQQFGKFQGFMEPGINMYCPCIQSVSNVSLAVRQIECHTECKTKDNATMTVRTAIQYRINKLRVKQAVFEIDNPEAQIRAAVDNVVRSSLPSMELDAAFQNKDTLRHDILSSVRDAMHQFGYLITNVLVTDLSPDRALLQAMNAQLAARRQREAAIEQGEAQKVLQVKAAEADADAKFLSGQGMARMRTAIADGFKDSMASMSDGGLSPQEAMHMMITTQYLDTLKDFANNPNHSSIMVPHGPGAVKDIEAQVRDGFISASAMKPGQQKMK